DTGGKDGDKQVKTKLQGLEETVLGGFSPTYKNSLVLTAPPIIMDEMVKMIKELDIPQQQVQIEARLVEMNENASRELGSTLKLTKKGATTADVSLLNSQTGTSGLATGAITKNITVFGQAYDLAGTLQAYEERNMLTTLANPRVVTLNKQAAAVSFVKQIPYITSTTSGDTVSEVVNFKDAGVDIGVLPTVTNTKNVHMAIGVTQSIKTGVVETSEGNEVPVVDKRQVQGQVIANSGDTIVMGGLRAMDLTDTTAGVPWLHQVPVLGWLFKSKTNAVSKTELFVFVTPRVLDDVIVTPEQKAHYDKIDTKWHMPDYFYDDVKTDADKN
ncbi:TPA: hypothetical protein DDW35_01300, partial [Candidatus Sumerlaeota bacterium]|nr:hypothetical protein [Candidatus Sumerlaeota bacterium]